MVNRISVSAALTVLALALLLTASLTAQTTSTLAAETGDNTSVGSFPQHDHGNVAAGNVSKLDTHALLYPGATTRVYAHFVPWFCTSGTSGCGCSTDASGVQRCNGHITTGYNSNDAAEVKKQVDDMISRGIDGMIVDWYGEYKAIENGATLKVMAEAASRTPVFEFAIMLDKGAVDSCQSNNAGMSQRDCAIKELNYAAAHFYASPAYAHRNSRPVVLFFGLSSLTNADWDAVRAGVSGNPEFVFEYGSFSHEQSNGAYTWVQPGIDNVTYLDDFYAAAMAASTQIPIGSSSKGFDDHYATWGSNRFIDQGCGGTWLQYAGRAAASGYSSAKQLDSFQLVTWNDYDEGTEIESGIDNCLGIAATLAGNTLSWTLSGTGAESTVDRYRVWSTPTSDGQNLTLRKEVTAGGAHSVDLSTVSLPAGSYTIYLQAVGKPSILNHMAAGVAYTAGGGAPVTVSQPAEGSSVSSEVHVVATENTSRSATSMQIYRDGTLVVTTPNVDALDTFIDAGCGAHTLTVKAWYADGTNNPVTVHTTVLRANLVTAPTAGATVASPVHVVSTSCSNNTVTTTQVYLDNALNTSVSGSSIDTTIAMASGPHCIVGKGWDSAGSFLTTNICFTVQ